MSTNIQYYFYRAIDWVLSGKNWRKYSRECIEVLIAPTDAHSLSISGFTGYVSTYLLQGSEHSLGRLVSTHWGTKLVSTH